MPSFCPQLWNKDLEDTPEPLRQFPWVSGAYGVRPEGKKKGGEKILEE